MTEWLSCLVVETRLNLKILSRVTYLGISLIHSIPNLFYQGKKHTCIADFWNHGIPQPWHYHQILLILNVKLWIAQIRSFSNQMAQLPFSFQEGPHHLWPLQIVLPAQPIHRLNVRKLTLCVSRKCFRCRDSQHVGCFKHLRHGK